MWKIHILYIFLLWMIEMRLALNLTSFTFCDLIPGLSWRQKHFCIESPSAFVALSEGYRMGGEECKHQFKGYRWNCSKVWLEEVFTHIIYVGSREAAYTYAIASAGAAYAITSACARGKIDNCGCGKISGKNSKGSAIKILRSNINSTNSNTEWKWGGCSVDVDFGIKYAKRFLDAREIERDGRSMMNLHNNRAGRRIVKDLLRIKCKCHGISGSCSLKTCWKTLPPFRVIGNAMMKRYHKAKNVRAVKTRRGVKLILTKYSRMGKKDYFPKRMELVYLESSPNYCENDNELGILGTRGRQCNNTINGPHSCDLLCCGRGYDIQEIKRIQQCHCKFKWCCKVDCDICEEHHKQWICK